MAKRSDLVIRGGTLVTADSEFKADIGIMGEKISILGRGIEGERVLDAEGMLVLPGAIDPHVHLDMPAGEFRSSDDWETGTIAAACGGTTTVIDFVEPEGDESLLKALELRRGEADGCAVIDYGLHMTLRDADAGTLRQVPEVCAAGCTSFKTYTTYAGFRLEDGALLKVLEAVREADGLVLVHAESDAMITYLRSRLLNEGNTAPLYHPQSRPPAAEVEAIERVIQLAGISGGQVYVVHVSTSGGVEALRRARAMGWRVYGETCPQYLILTDAEYSRPGFEGAKFVCSPPLRPHGNAEGLWQGLRAGDLHTVATDHCPFFFEGQKDRGLESFVDIPNGLPGVELRLALLYSFGVRQGRISAPRWVELLSTAPAKIFGMYPQKGSLTPGADADLVIFDPGHAVAVTAEALHERVDYTPYEGLQITGAVHTTLSRGEVIFSEGEFRGRKGRGRFLPRR